VTDSLWIKPADALNSNVIGITALHVSGSPSAHHREFLAVVAVPSCSWQHTIIKLHKMYQCRCTAKNSWWWAEGLPETCRVVISIKLEFSASVGFIHREENWKLHIERCGIYTIVRVLIKSRLIRGKGYVGHMRMTEMYTVCWESMKRSKFWRRKKQIPPKRCCDSTT
jgi:hypothetical protein